MKYIIIGWLFFGSIHTMAQSNPEITKVNYLDKAQQETLAMTARLNLTSIQKDSVSNINKDSYGQIAFLRDEALTNAQRTARMLAIDSSRKARLRITLTSAQFDQYFGRLEQAAKFREQRLDSLRQRPPQQQRHPNQ